MIMIIMCVPKHKEIYGWITLVDIFSCATGYFLNHRCVAEFISTFGNFQCSDDQQQIRTKKKDLHIFFLNLISVNFFLLLLHNKLIVCFNSLII